MEELKIKLGQYRNVNSTNADEFDKINLLKNESILTQYDTFNVLDVSELYNTERKNCKRYKIYGKFEYLSLLNNSLKNYTSFSELITWNPDYIEGVLVNKKNIENSFKFYLVKPSASEYTSIGNNQYIRKYDVISNISDLKIFNAGYSVNLFNDCEYIFSFEIDVDLSNTYDFFNHLINEVFLYCEYQPSKSGYDFDEILEIKKYDSMGGSYYETYSPTEHVSGDTFDGNLVSFVVSDYMLNSIDEFTHRIETFYESGGTESIRWYYNPLIPIRISYMSDEYQIENISGTSYENIIKIPEYASEFDSNGNYIWRDILENGYVDPLTNNGVNFPFLNNKHYVYSNIILSIQPDMSHINTYLMFNQTILNNYNLIGYKNKNTKQFGNACDNSNIDCCS